VPKCFASWRWELPPEVVQFLSEFDLARRIVQSELIGSMPEPGIRLPPLGGRAMTLLRWKDEYSVGIEAVDHEHRELIDLINVLHERLYAADAKVTVPDFFGDLLKGISAHFALEESFMREQGYPRLVPHKDDHERLLDELREIMDAFEQSEEIDVLELSRRLESWFSLHFRTHDAELHRAIGAHPH